MKVTLYYFYDSGFVLNEEDRISASTIDWRGEYQGDRIFLKELEIEIPDCPTPTKEEITNGLIATLNEEKQSVLAECHRKVSIIEEKISRLLCIENKEFSI